MKKYFILFILLSLVNFSSFCQVNDKALWQVVLGKNCIDSSFVFGEWNEENGTEETHLKYLGVLETEKSNYKIITSTWLWGISKRATNRILVFSDDNRYLGNYYIGMLCDLPDKLINDKLIFYRSKCNGCDDSLIVEISFKDGVFDDFFLECSNGMGDIYSFDNNKSDKN